MKKLLIAMMCFCVLSGCSSYRSVYQDEYNQVRAEYDSVRKKEKELQDKMYHLKKIIKADKTVHKHQKHL